jgi:large subunit ribosomal protein L21
MYAIVKTGGKQYRVEEGQSLLVERLPVDDGGKVALEPLLYVDGSSVLDGAELAKVTIEARVVAHERGPKLRIVKFKPKRGYRRRTGHRQDLTRIEVTSIKLGGGRRSAGSRAKQGGPVAGEEPAAVTAEKAPAAAEQATVEEHAPAAAAVPPEESPAAAEQVAAEEQAPAAAAVPPEESPAQAPDPDPTDTTQEEGNGA